MCLSHSLWVTEPRTCPPLLILPCVLARGGGLPGWFLFGLAVLRARRPKPPYLPMCVGGSWHACWVGQPKQLPAFGNTRLIASPRHSLRMRWGLSEMSTQSHGQEQGFLHPLPWRRGVQGEPTQPSWSWRGHFLSKEYVRLELERPGFRSWLCHCEIQ